MKVALGAAKGLAFLHSDEAKVIYQDFKTSNILLVSVCKYALSTVIDDSLNFCRSLIFFFFFSNVK